MNEVKERLREQMDICREKAESTRDSEEFEKFIESEVKLAKALADIEKNEQELSFEKTKYEESKKEWLSPKFLIPVILPCITLVIGKVMDRNTLRQQTMDICNFEKTNTFTTQAGKGLAGCLRMFPILNNRGDH